MFKVALATCQNLPAWEVDDRVFWEALRGVGVEVCHPVWNDKAVDWRMFDLVLPRTTWDYQQHAEDFLEWLGYVDEVSLLLNPLEVMRWNLDKRYLQKFEGVVPDTWWVDRGTVLSWKVVRAEFARRGWRRGFIKPCVGACSWGTLRFDVEDQVEDQVLGHLNEWLGSQDMMVQPYFESVETVGEFSCVFFDGVLSHGVQKVPVAGDYRVQDDFGAQDFAWEPSPSFLDVCSSVLGEVGEGVLYARCDFLVDRGGNPRLIELELIEPSLFFRHDREAAGRLADAVLRRLQG